MESIMHLIITTEWSIVFNEVNICDHAIGFP